MGTVLTGTVKSYSAKGFGFILCPDVDHDVYFARESLQEGLRTANIAGTTVTFELCRGLHGKPQARYLRPVSALPPVTRSHNSYSSFPPAVLFAARQERVLPPTQGAEPVYDSRCASYANPSPCAAWGMNPMMPPAPPRPPSIPVTPGQLHEAQQRRTLSPHAGSRAMMGIQKKAAESDAESSDSGGERSSEEESSDSSRRKKKKKKEKRKSEKKKKHKKEKQKDGGTISSSSGSRSSSHVREVRSRSPRREGKSAPPLAAAPTTEEEKQIEVAKQEALVQLEKLRKMEPKEARMKEWRILLREWHPDKNPEKQQVATAVFQFLQKGKALLERV